MRQKIKPKLFYLAALAFGISLCFTLQLSNLSSLFQFLGVNADKLPYLWLAPPLTGLLIQPIIGQISDDTISKYGKRRPYIFIWTLLTVISFAMLPFFDSLFAVISITWIMDCSLNGGTEALKALTGDVTVDDKQRSQAFSLQAFFAGIGGALGVSLPIIIHKFYPHWDNVQNSLGSKIPFSLKISFLLTSVMLLAILIIFMLKVKEKPYTHGTLLSKRKKPIAFTARVVKIFRDLFYNIKKMPPKFRVACLIHSASWIGIFIFWMYFTNAIAQSVYHLPQHPDMLGNAAHASMLKQATLDAAFYNSIYQYVSIICSLVLFYIARNSKALIYMHAATLLIGGLGISLIGLESSPYAICASMVAYGIMWGSIPVLPYAIAMKYLPKGKIGIYLGIFNICITAPQILCSLFITPIYLYLFNGSASYLLAFAGFMILMSAFFWIQQFGNLAIFNFTKVFSFATQTDRP